jgi:hypothetical protein
MRQVLVLISAGLSFCLGALTERITDFAVAALIGGLFLAWLGVVVLAAGFTTCFKDQECWLCQRAVSPDADMCPHCKARL